MYILNLQCANNTKTHTLLSCLFESLCAYGEAAVSRRKYSKCYMLSNNQKINYNDVRMLHNVPASVQKDYSVAALLLLHPAMKANKGRGKIAHKWMSRWNLEIGSWQKNIVCAQGKLIKVFDSCAMFICCFMLWLTHKNQNPIPFRLWSFSIIMRKSPSPPAIRKQSQNLGNQIRFNRVIIYN